MPVLAAGVGKVGRHIVGIVGAQFVFRRYLEFSRDVGCYEGLLPDAVYPRGADVELKVQNRVLPGIQHLNGLPILAVRYQDGVCGDLAVRHLLGGRDGNIH